MEQDYLYKLIKADSSDEALPDSMNIYLEKDRPNILKIEYYDLNNDRNCIYILKEYYEDKIKENLFDINLPDSVEIILLP